MINLFYMQMKGTFLVNSNMNPIEKEVLANHFIFIGLIICVLFLLKCNLFGLLLPGIVFIQKVLFENLMNILQDQSGAEMNNVIKLLVESFALFGVCLYFIQRNRNMKKYKGKGKCF